jgi:hypothetical protein
MILTIENTSGAGKPCRVFDAAGCEIAWVLYADTETGEVETYKQTKGRQLIEGEDGNLERETKICAAPLSVMWIEK